MALNQICPTGVFNQNLQQVHHHGSQNNGQIGGLLFFDTRPFLKTLMTHGAPYGGCLLVEAAKRIGFFLFGLESGYGVRIGGDELFLLIPML